MSNLSAAKLLLKKIREQAQNGQNGSANYAMDRLKHIETLAGMAERKLSDEH